MTMKPSIFHFIICLCLSATIFSSCTKTTCTSETTYVIHTPVFESRESINAKIGSSVPQSIENPGKMFSIGNFILMNEANKGIHVINNSDKTNPVAVAFINIPGSLDVYILGNRLYADSYNDLVVLDISDINNVQLIERVNDVFYDNGNFPFLADENGDIVIDYIESSETIKTDCSHDGNINFFIDAGSSVIRPISGITNTMDFSSFRGGEKNIFAIAETSVTGRAGSMSRFGSHSDLLYAVNNYELICFQPGESLTKIHTEFLAFGIETIFPYNEYLFVGGQNGMYILDATDPARPTLLSTFTHANSCDPVVVDGNHAYVTLRSGNECNGFSNQLDVIDISDIRNPKLDKTYPLHNPHGLGVAGNLLFICDGSEGLKIYNKENPLKISDNLIQHYKNIHAFDVIPFQNVLLMVGELGLYQYDYSDINNIRLLSILSIN